MTVKRKLETMVEDAWIAVLGASEDVTKAKRWRDGSTVRTYPVSLVHCSPVGDEPEIVNGDLYIANVELGAQTDTISDKDQAVLQAELGAIRDVCKSATLIASLNAAANGIKFLDRGISLEGGDNNIDVGEVSQDSLTAVCHIQYTGS